MKQRRWTSLGLAVVAACGYPRLGPLAEGDDDAGVDAGPAGEALELVLVAGDVSGPGNVDGTAGGARFNRPGGVAIDRAGNAYLADTFNSTLRKVTPAGIVTTLAGTAGAYGSANGTGPAARFDSLVGVAVDRDGNAYVADTNNAIIRKVTPDGVVTTIAGSAGVPGDTDGTGGDARFRAPTGVAVTSAGTLYVADRGNATIRKITPAGEVTTLAGLAGVIGSANGVGSAARFDEPSSVALDGAENVYVADTDNATIRKITPAGAVTTLAGTAGVTGDANGTGPAARFDEPTGVAVDRAGNVYVADRENDLIRKVTFDGVVTTVAGESGIAGSIDAAGPAARFSHPTGVAVDSADILYVADQDNHALRRISSTGVVTTPAGAASQPGDRDATGAAARFDLPSSVAVDAAGTSYVADARNHTIRRITADGVVTTLAGLAGTPGGADGTGPAARFNFPSGVAVDIAGAVYVADTDNATIRKITAAGVVTTLAGSPGKPGSANGTGAAARFDSPTGIAVDPDGVVYVADLGNHTVRRISRDGVVTTLAGTPGQFGSANGTGADARFNFPSGVALDSAGVLYVADENNQSIRKVTAAGAVTTLAGTAGMPGTTDGTGADARFRSPLALAVDRAGTVYVADATASTIRKITPAGVTTTFAGTPGVTGVLLGAAPRLAFPRALAVAGDDLILCDANAVLRLRRAPAAR